MNNAPDMSIPKDKKVSTKLMDSQDNRNRGDGQDKRSEYKVATTMMIPISIKENAVSYAKKHHRSLTSVVVEYLENLK